jgi:hypothetical protein
MKTLLATIIGLALVASANPASAYLVAVATSFEMTSTADETDLKEALKVAADDVLSQRSHFRQPS